MILSCPTRIARIGGQEMQTQPGPEGGANRRSEPRPRTLKGGRIVFNGGYSSFDCTVRNLSTGGALLQVATTADIPNTFDLIINNSGDTRYHCTVRWRTHVSLGVAFAPA